MKYVASEIGNVCPGNLEVPDDCSLMTAHCLNFSIYYLPRNFRTRHIINYCNGPARLDLKPACCRGRVGERRELPVCQYPSTDRSAAAIHSLILQFVLTSTFKGGHRRGSSFPTPRSCLAALRQFLVLLRLFQVPP